MGNIEMQPINLYRIGIQYTDKVSPVVRAITARRYRFGCKMNQIIDAGDLAAIMLR